MLSKEEIIKKVAEVPFWGHSIPLPYGIVTPGKVMDNLETFKRLGLPDDLSGKRVLDVGCLDGFYSFECEKRGAQVLAIDNCERMKRPDEKQYAYLGNRGFEVVKEILESKVEFLNMDVYDISVENVGKFDIVLFLGILYHLKYPLLALEKIYEVTNDGGSVYIETAWLTTLGHAPLLYYCEGDSFNQDPTNWFIPNTMSLLGMIKDAGFQNAEIIYKTPFSWKGCVKSVLNRSLCMSGRIIVKAYK